MAQHLPSLHYALGSSPGTVQTGRVVTALGRWRQEPKVNLGYTENSKPDKETSGHLKKKKYIKEKEKRKRKTSPANSSYCSHPPTKHSSPSNITCTCFLCSGMLACEQGPPSELGSDESQMQREQPNRNIHILSMKHKGVHLGPKVQRSINEYHRALAQVCHSANEQYLFVGFSFLRKTDNQLRLIFNQIKYLSVQCSQLHIHLLTEKAGFCAICRTQHFLKILTIKPSLRKMMCHKRRIY